MRVVLTVLVALLPAFASAAVTEEVSAQRLYEAGKYDEAAAILAEAEQAPDVVYLRARTLERMNQPDQAKDVLRQLVRDDEQDAWSAVARSAVASLEGDPGGAVAAAERAAQLAPDLFHAQYQLGLAYASADNPQAASRAFDAAIRLNPSFAYAHYHAGQAAYEQKKIAVMVSHFEDFLKVAPQAPERPAVERLLRTLRGR